MNEVINSFHFFKAYYHYANLLDKSGKKQDAIDYMKNIIGSSKDLPDYKLEKEQYWIDAAYKFLRKNGVELAWTRIPHSAQKSWQFFLKI